MERLTAWEDGNAYYKQCFEEPCLGNGCEIEDCELNSEYCKRLAQYEDTELTPEQVREINKLYTEKCREVAELKKKQAPMKPIKDRTQNIRYTSAYSCPNCGGGFAGTGIADYCYHCGQRLDWEG